MRQRYGRFSAHEIRQDIKGDPRGRESNDRIKQMGCPERQPTANYKLQKLSPLGHLDPYLLAAIFEE
jgi:hypothetical protein